MACPAFHDPSLIISLLAMSTIKVSRVMFEVEPGAGHGQDKNGETKEQVGVKIYEQTGTI